MVDLYEILKKLEISYEEVEHEAVFTMEDIKKLDEHLEGMQLKNLFVKDRFDNRYLIVVDEDKRFDLKALKEINTDIETKEKVLKKSTQTKDLIELLDI